MEKLIEGLSTTNQLLHWIDLPYNDELIMVPLLSKYKVPHVELYDGPQDPVDHLTNFKAHTIFYNYLEELAC